MVRLEGWENKFSNYLDEKRNMPFKWGDNDCILFAAKGLEIITGEDYYSKYLPYNNEEEAKNILKKNGGFAGIIKKSLGKPHDNYKKARRGDLVLLKIPNITCGIVDDSGKFIACPSENGIVRYPISNAYKIWSV